MMLFHDKLESVSPCANYFLTLKWSLKSRFEKKKNWLFLWTNDFSSSTKWLFSGKQWISCFFSWIEMSFDMKEDSLKQKMVYQKNVVFYHEKYQFLYHSFSFWIGRLYHLHFELKSWIQKSKIFYLPSQKSFSFFLQFQLARHFIRHWRLSKAAIIQLCYMKSALNLCV